MTRGTHNLFGTLSIEIYLELLIVLFHRIRSSIIITSQVLAFGRNHHTQFICQYLLSTLASMNA